MARKIKTLPKILGVTAIATILFFGVKHFMPSKEDPTAPAPSDSGAAAQIALAPAAVGSTALRMTGSSTIGAALAPKLAMAFLTKQGASDARENDDKANERITVTGTVGGKLTSITIDYPGSGAAFDCLATQRCDIGLSSRAIQPTEEAKLASLGNMRTLNTEHVLAMDGIAVIVNATNYRSVLTVDQVQQIFLGQITDWSQLGGAQTGTIHVFSRDSKSGTYDSFVHMALGGRDIPSNRGPIKNDNDAVTNAVAKDPLAISFVGLAYIGQAKALSIQNGNTTPLEPSFFTVGTEDYAFSRRLYLYTPPSPQAAWVQPFVDYALSDEGQRIVAQVGFVSLNVSATEAALPVGAPAGYVRDIRGAKRLSFNFRFEFGGTNLDGKALADLNRMASYLKTTRPTSIALLGFADKQGAEAANVQLSKARAGAVASALKPFGIDVQIIDGFGSALPVAPNDTPEGRERNRRVEAWVL